MRGFSFLSPFFTTFVFPQSMHWATPKTADRMLLPDAGSSDGSTATPRGVPGESIPAPRGGRAPVGSVGVGRPHLADWRRSGGSELVRKFRNYEI